MALFPCGCKRDCVVTALVASAIIGVITAFLQITAVITVTPVFLWVVFGIAVVYLGVLEVAAARTGRAGLGCCRALGAVLTGILGAALLAVLLLAVGIVATSVVSAILVGLLLFFFSLILTATACLIRCFADCED